MSVEFLLQKGHLLSFNLIPFTLNLNLRIRLSVNCYFMLLVIIYVRNALINSFCFMNKCIYFFQLHPIEFLLGSSTKLGEIIVLGMLSQMKEVSINSL